MKKLLSILCLSLFLLPLTAAPKAQGKTNPVVLKKGYTVSDWAKEAELANYNAVAKLLDVSDSKKVLVYQYKADSAEASKCMAIIDLYQELFATIIGEIDQLSGITAVGNQGSSEQNIVHEELNGFTREVQALFYKEGDKLKRKLDMYFKSPDSFEYSMSATEVSSEKSFKIYGKTKNLDKLTMSDLDGLKSEFYAAFPDLKLRQEAIETIGFTNKDTKQDFYKTYVVYSFDKAGFGKTLEDCIAKFQ